MQKRKKNIMGDMNSLRFCRAMSLAAMALASSTLFAAAPADAPEFSIGGHISPEAYAGMSLVWRDEFSGSALDSQTWSHETGASRKGRRNNELQYYRPENTQVRNGFLVISAVPGEHRGSAYTSSRLTSRGSREVRFGRVDVRALLPGGQGIRPAVRMLGASMPERGWPAAGEIDIVEMVGGEGREDTVHGTLHWQQGGGHFYEGGAITLPSGRYSEYFHVFSIIWDESAIRWLVDDYEYFRVALSGAGFDAFREPFYFMINLAVGGDWPGSPDHTTAFPQHLVLDYIRVFQHTD